MLKLHLVVRAIFMLSSFDEIRISDRTKELVSNSKNPMFLINLAAAMVSGIQISATKGMMICLSLENPLLHYQTYVFCGFCFFVVIY